MPTSVMQKAVVSEKASAIWAPPGICFTLDFFLITKAKANLFREPANSSSIEGATPSKGDNKQMHEMGAGLVMQSFFAA